MNKDGTGVGTLFEVAVKDEHLGKLGEPVNFVQYGSVKCSLGHCIAFFCQNTFCSGFVRVRA